VFEDYRGFLMALLPPGAFIGLGLIVALKNAIDAKQATKPAKVQAETTGVEATA
jgi:electron transport complex protein RnfE